MLTFLKQALDPSNQVGAVLPSSPGLARQMILSGDVRSSKVVVELGPGTGAFTGKLIESLNPESYFLAVERNEAFVHELRRRFPSTNVCLGDAGQADFLSELGLRRAEIAEQEEASRSLSQVLGVDSVLSGLPWASFPESLQRRILENVVKQLRTGGCFVTFAYLGPHWMKAGARFRGLLKEYFGQYETSKVVWANVPPAFVYRCEKLA